MASPARASSSAPRPSAKKDEDLVNDVAFLRELWRDVQAKAEDPPRPTRLAGFRLLQKVLRDLFREEVASFWVDDPAHLRRGHRVRLQTPSGMGGAREAFHPDLPIFEAFGIEQGDRRRALSQGVSPNMAAAWSSTRPKPW
ncbi:MAG: ribonuclease E/G [Holophagaceae bacterium]|nr:ribonuclease E/G [Holophagaceae bacterium]